MTKKIKVGGRSIVVCDKNPKKGDKVLWTPDGFYKIVRR